MPNKDSRVLFKAGLFENYSAIEAKDTNTIYFCTDTQQMFVGDIEYTRPIQVGAAEPDTFAPPFSLFFNTTTKVLYYSDGTKWNRAVNDFTYTHPNSGVAAKAYGDTADQTPAFGAAFKVPSFTVDAQGHLTVAGEHTVTLPTAPTFTDTGATDIEVTGTGNAVTAASYDDESRKITLTKGATFALPSDVSSAVSTHAALAAAAALGHVKTGGDITFTAGVGTVTGIGGAKPGAASGLATLGADTKVPIAQLPTGTGASQVALGNHAHAFSAITDKPTTLAGYGITDVPASTISGIIDIENLPAASLERLYVAEDDDARLALTTEDVQNGDTVKVQSTGKMYFVKDDTKLGGETPEEAFEEYTVGSASSVAWTGVTGKPTVAYTLTGDVAGTVSVQLGNAVSIDASLPAQSDPSLESGGTFTKVTVNAKGIVTAGAQATKADVGLGNVDNTADSVKSVASAAKLTTARKINGVGFDGTEDITITAAPTAHQHPVSDVTGMAALSIKVGSAAAVAYTPAAAKSITIDLSTIGAAAATHTHAITQLTSTSADNGKYLVSNGTGVVAQALPVASTSAAGIIQIGAGATNAAAGNHTHADYVPITRTVNGKALNANITLTATDVGAASSTHTHTGAQVTLTGYVKPGAYSAVAVTDTANAAIGKLEAGVLEAKAAATASALVWDTF